MMSPNLMSISEAQFSAYGDQHYPFGMIRLLGRPFGKGTNPNGRPTVGWCRDYRYATYTRDWQRAFEVFYRRPPTMEECEEWASCTGTGLTYTEAKPAQSAARSSEAPTRARSYPVPPPSIDPPRFRWVEGRCRHPGECWCGPTKVVLKAIPICVGCGADSELSWCDTCVSRAAARRGQ